MFQSVRSPIDSRRADRLASIYHRGQELAWDGRAVLAALIKEHGGVRMKAEELRALEGVFAILMWGELAAWRVSAQLADHIVPLEAKMAATSQAHDEARHFYVLHDFLDSVGAVPRRPDKHSERVLALVMETTRIPEKLLGMQLLIENIALTIFHAIEKRNLDPVLNGILGYIAKDEARHVGLGMQYLPQQLRDLSPVRRAAFFTFQLRLTRHVIFGLKAIAPDLETLGISPKAVFIDGTARQRMAAEELFSEMGAPPGRVETAIDWAIERAAATMFTS